MNLEQIETIIAKNLTITDQRLMDGVIGAVLDAVAAEREECARVLDKVIEHLYIYNYDGDASTELRRCANAIRARGNDEPR